MISVVRGVVTETTSEAILRETRPDGAVVSPPGKALVSRLGEAAHLLDLDDAPIGSAWLTPAGPLRASFLIHLVVQGTDEPVSAESVRLALTNALRRAAAFGIESVALSPFGVGAGNLAHEHSAHVTVTAIESHLEQGQPPSVFEIFVTSEYEEEVFRRAVGSSPESHPEPRPESHPEPRPDPDSEPGPDPDPEPGSESGLDRDPKPDPKPETGG